MRTILLIMALVLSGCATSRRQAYVDANPNTPYAEQILKGSVTMGMIGDEVKASMGFPDTFTHYESLYGGREFWHYGFTDMYGVLHITLSIEFEMCCDPKCSVKKRHGHVVGWTQ